MFGRKGSAAETKKKLSPKDLVAQQIDAIEPGKELMFRLGPIYVKPFITVVHNTDAAKKFTVLQEAADASGAPGGKRGKFWETGNAKEIASWVLEREGQVYEG